MATGWPTAADYKAWARIADAVDDVPIADALAASIAYAEERCSLIEADEPAPADATYAVKLLARRLLARRNSPEGIIGSFDGVVADIGRYDPDVARLLGPHMAARLA
jgi:hypothetical protein